MSQAFRRDYLAQQSPTVPTGAQALYPTYGRTARDLLALSDPEEQSDYVEYPQPPEDTEMSEFGWWAQDPSSGDYYHPDSTVEP